jgi:hypothetical protein
MDIYNFGNASFRKDVRCASFFPGGPHLQEKKDVGPTYFSIIRSPPSTTGGRTASAPHLGRARQPRRRSPRSECRPTAPDTPPLLTPPAYAAAAAPRCERREGVSLPAARRISGCERREGAPSLPAAGGRASTSRGSPLLLQSRA